MLIIRTLSLLTILLALPAKAHEFWIEPQSYMIQPNDTIVADVRNGQLFKGSSFAYVPDDYAKYNVILGDQNTGLEATIGQRPAFMTLAEKDGLAILVAETNADIVSYSDWAKFQKFVDHKDLGVSESDHLSAGFPAEKFKETYRRFTKALVGVGDAEGEDQLVGMEIELVALANPYRDDTSKGMPVKAYFKGAPLANVQIELFEKNSTEDVNITLHRTDAQGLVNLPVKSGHSYLVDTVQLRKAPKTDDPTVVWETLWAALTFAIP